MAQVGVNIHLRPEDEILVERGEHFRWIKIGGLAGVAIFADDAQMAALRLAIDAYLAESLGVPAEAA